MFSVLANVYFHCKSHVFHWETRLRGSLTSHPCPRAVTEHFPAPWDRRVLLLFLCTVKIPAGFLLLHHEMATLSPAQLPGSIGPRWLWDGGIPSTEHMASGCCLVCQPHLHLADPPVGLKGRECSATWEFPIWKSLRKHGGNHMAWERLPHCSVSSNAAAFIKACRT